MKDLQLVLPPFMKDPILIGEEISITGKWLPELREEFSDIHLIQKR